MRTVLATTSSGIEVSNNVRTCAERRLLETLVRRARERGVHAHRIAHAVRRAAGLVSVTRLTAAGEDTCSLPCLFCRRKLDALHVRWRAHDWSGPVDCASAPPSNLTQRQRMLFH